MARKTLPAAGSRGNPPTIQDIEATMVGVRADEALNAVEVEVRDPIGAGFRFLMGCDQAIEVALRVAAAACKLAA